MKTTTQVINESNIPAKLIRSVIKQLGYKESLPDIARHGIDGGFHGFIYYKDTVPFYKRNRKEILELLEEYAQSFGESPMKIVQGFSCLKGQSDIESSIGRCLYGNVTEEDTTVANALAWFAAEEVARAFCDE